MKVAIHEEILRTALAGLLANQVMETVISANIHQDDIKYQVGHDHFHYDSDSFDTADAFCAALRSQVQENLGAGDLEAARVAFGKLTHTVQDFYAHSNYVELWQRKFPNLRQEEIDPQDDEIIRSGRLRSGRLYYPLEAITFIPGIPSWVIQMFPQDSHARMNKDHAGKQNFKGAFAAAIKRTTIELAWVKNNVKSEQYNQFCGN